MAWKTANDRWLNIETVNAPIRPATSMHNPATKHQDNFAFASVDYWDLRRILHRVAPSAQDVVFEIGAGLGRAACLFARYPIRKVVAIELNPVLCEHLAQNARTLRGRRCQIEIRSEDAVQTRFDDGTIFFLYNPFGPDTLRDVLANVRSSQLAVPRPVQLVYVNPQAGHRAVFSQQAWLSDAGRMRTLHGLDVFFFRTSRGTP